jgi:hypothetical protein
MDKQTKNIVNKIWAFLQTTGGKDEPNIVFMRKWQYITDISLLIDWLVFNTGKFHIRK